MTYALNTAYGDQEDSNSQRFLQRILYRINRLNLFWYDDFERYRNEHSFYLQWIRDRIEQVWQAWEIAPFDLDAYRQPDVIYDRGGLWPFW